MNISKTRQRFAMATILALGVLLVPASESFAQKRKTFRGQLFGAAADLVDAISKDRKLKDRKFTIGKITTQLPNSNFELEIIRTLKASTELKPLLSEDSSLYLQGEYNFLGTGNEAEHDNVAVIEVVLKITNNSGMVLTSVRREINETDDIARLTGTTLSPPDTQEFKVRNEKFKEAINDPKFEVINGSEIIAPGNPMYSVQILRSRNGGPFTSVVPVKKGGHAFVDLAVSDTFHIVLRSYDLECRSVGKVSIDGLSVVNTFSEDKKEYAGYALNKAKNKSTASKHVVPGWLRTTTTNKKNVWQFSIKEFGKGAATEMQSKSTLGVINVRFVQAAETPDGFRGRKYGEVGRGEQMDVDYSVKQLQLLDVAESIINIRYSIPIGS